MTYDDIHFLSLWFFDDTTRFSALGGSLFDLGPPSFWLACDPPLNSKVLVYVCDPFLTDPALKTNIYIGVSDA